MRVAIFGGAGFLGQCLARRCVAQGWDVIIYDLAGTDPKIWGTIFHALDLQREKPPMDDSISVIYYLAQSPYYRLFPQCMDHIFEVNTLGALRAAQAAIDCGCRFFCYASSGSVYQWSFHPLHEGMPVRRNDPYVLSKLAAEEMLRFFSSSFCVLNVRIFGLFGPGQKNMLPAVIRDKISGRETIELQAAHFEGDDSGGLRISFCFVEDASVSLVRLAEQAMAGDTLPEVINLAGPKPISMKEFAEIMGRHMGLKPIFIRSSNLRAFDLIADINLLEQTIQPTFTGLELAVKTMLKVTT